MINETGHKLLGRTQRILLELSTVLYFFARNSAIPLVQQYVYFLVAKKYNFTADMADSVSRYITDDGQIKRIEMEHTNKSFEYFNSSESDESLVTVTIAPGIRHHVRDIIKLSNKVNEESSLVILYLTVAELLPTAIVVLFLGCYSDLTGKRRFMMWLPCIGNALYALGFLLPLYICSGDIDCHATKILFVLACLISGLCGNVPGYLSGNASYISDTDSPRRRTLRLAIVELSIGLTFGISSLMNGYWIAATSHFEQPLWFVVVCSLVPFVILFFFLREPTGEVASQLSLTPTSYRSLRGIKHVFGCKTLPQKKLWAIFMAFQVYVFVQQGQERIFVQFFQSHPLSWSPPQIGLFIFVLYVVAGFGSWPGVPLLQKLVSDLSIAAISLLSKLLGSLIMAFAQDSFTVYLAGIVQIFHLAPYAVARSLVSQQMGEDEQGSVYALLHSAQALVSFFGPVVHNAIFTVTLAKMSGAVFLISGPLLLLPLILLGCTRYLEQVEEEGYASVDGSTSRAKPFSPSSMTPLSETAGFAQRSPDFRNNEASP